MAEKILITGATGTIGKALVKALQDKGASFVVGVRNVDKAKELLGTATPAVQFDYEDPATFKGATEGVNSVFLLGPPLRTDLDSLVIPFADYLKDSGIRRVVYVGALGLDQLQELPFHTRVIDHLKKNDFEYTILQPSFFAQNFKNYEGENIIERGISFVPAGNGKAGFVDVEDIALVAATVLTEDGHTHRSYQLTGPDLLSYSDVAEQLSELLDKPVHYVNPSPAIYAQTLKDAGVPDFVAPYMSAVYSLISDNKVNLLTDDVERVTGKRPTALSLVLQRDFSVLVN